MNANVHIEPGTLPEVTVFPPDHSRDWEFVSTEFHCRRGGYVDIHGDREDMIRAARHILSVLSSKPEELL